MHICSNAGAASAGHHYLVRQRKLRWSECVRKTAVGYGGGFG